MRWIAAVFIAFAVARPLERQSDQSGSRGGIHGWSPIGAEINGTGAIQQLLERRLPPSYHNLFEFSLADISTSNDSYDPFTIQTQNTSNKILITSPTTPGLSRGLLTYLRTRGGDIYWNGDMFRNEYLESSFSNASQWEGRSWAEKRYLFSQKTFSIAMVWWGWSQWEYVLDWASMHGINFPLALVGQEYIWAEVYRDFGVSEEEVLKYFAGPAFEAWGRTGEVQGSWGGNITLDWLGKRWILQRQIITRMIALGMTPILPAFNGFVPPALQQYIGGPQFLIQPQFANFSGQHTYTSKIEPDWSTWNTVQSAFLTKQQELYGGWTSHYYSADLYNSLEPTSTAPDYLRSNGQNLVGSLKAVDPEAVWVLSGEPFGHNPERWTSEAIQGLLSGIQDDDVIVLDLSAEAVPVWNRTDSFYGKQWIWNVHVNYGGTDGLYGNLWHYAEEVVRARAQSPSLIGMGLTMEGLTNEVVQEFMLDTPWQEDVLDPSEWIQSFAVRRYGMGSSDMSNATQFVISTWQQLLGSAYNSTDPTVQGIPKSPLELIPAIEGLVNRTGKQPTKIPYQSQILMGGCLDLLSAAFLAPKLEDVDGYNYDMCQCARQVQLNAGLLMYENMIQEWRDGANATGVRRIGDELVQNLKDIDRVLRSNYHFMISNWISDARSWSDDPAVKDFYEYQARNQIGLFGLAPENGGEWEMDRYASKQWAGILGTYYANNWEIFINYLTETTPTNYSQEDVNMRIRAYNIQWENEKFGEREEEEIWGVSGERLLQVIAELRSRWAPWLESL